MRILYLHKSAEIRDHQWLEVGAADEQASLECAGELKDDISCAVLSGAALEWTWTF